VNFLGNPMAARPPVRMPIPKGKVQVDPYKMPRFQDQINPGVAPPGMADVLAGAGGLLAAPQAEAGPLPMAPVAPIQVNPLDPQYDFKRFRFNFGSQPGLLG
jgi:hypothetical protein